MPEPVLAPVEGPVRLPELVPARRGHAARSARGQYPAVARESSPPAKRPSGSARSRKEIPLAVSPPRRRADAAASDDVADAISDASMWLQKDGAKVNCCVSGLARAAAVVALSAPSYWA